MIELPYPHKALWPNGRPHHMQKAREVKKHRAWAHGATIADKTRPETFQRLVVTVYPKRFGPLPDKDNASAAVKSYQDGIADAFGINDRDLGQPAIQFGERCEHGKFVIDFVSTGISPQTGWCSDKSQHIESSMSNTLDPLNPLGGA